MSDEIQRYELSRYSGPIKNDKGDWVRYVDTHPAPPSELVKAAEEFCAHFDCELTPVDVDEEFKFMSDCLHRFRAALDKVKS